MQSKRSGVKIRSIKENAILNIVYTLANILFPLITYTYVLRILAVKDMGRIAFYTSVTNYATMLAALGLTTYGIRAVAKARDNKGLLNQVISELFTINIIATGIVIIIYLLLIFFVHQFSRDIILGLLNGLIIISAPFGMNWLFSGLEQYGYITKRTLLFKTISLLVILLFVRSQDDYYIYAAILTVSSIGTYICNYLYARHLTTFRFYLTYNLVIHLKPMLVLFASALAVSVYFNLDTVMLGFIKGDWEVGIYMTAVRVKTVLLELINAISVVLLPRLSFYLSKGRNEEYRDIVQKAMAIIFIISIPMSVFFILESMPAVLILGGSEYAPSSYVMKILMPILVISGFSNVLGNQILIPNGREGDFLKAVIIGAIADIILNYLLMPGYGSIGAAIATLIAEFSQMGIQTYYSKDVLKHNINWITILKVCLATIVASAAVLVLSQYSNFNNLIKMIVMVIVFFCIYVLFLLMIKEQYSREAVNGFISKFKKKR